jgi:hypothetical protein
MSSGTVVPSSRFATTTSGFRVSGAMPRRSAASSRASFASREGVDLRSRRHARLLLRLLERALDHGEVGEQQLRSDLDELRGRRGVRAEAPDHHAQRVHLAQAREPLRARDAAGHVDEADLRVHGLGGSLDLRQHVDPRIGNGDHREIGLPAVRSRVGDRREQRRGAAERHADEPDVLHASTLARASGRRGS